MEPFELKLQQVTFNESDRVIAQDQGQSQSLPLDSLSTLVHYDACFSHKDVSLNQSLDSAGLPDFSFIASGKSKGNSKGHSLRGPVGRSNLTKSEQVNKAIPSSPELLVGALPWESNYAVEIQQQEQFLVNPHDDFRTSSSFAKVSPESAAAGLRTLSQISSNTAAVSKHLKQIDLNKRKLRVARTTLTSTSLGTPRTMPSEIKSSEAVAGDGAMGKEEGDVTDNSFETVAEALRLQWSVIGNSNVTPVSPEEVARIVAEAEKRLKEGGSVLSSTTSSSNLATKAESSNHFSIPDSLELSHTFHGGGDQASLNSTQMQPSGELVRIQAQSITREVEKSSWLQSKKGHFELKADQPAQKKSEGQGNGSLTDMKTGTGLLHSESVKSNDSDPQKYAQLDNAGVDKAPIAMQTVYGGFHSVSGTENVCHDLKSFVPYTLNNSVNTTYPQVQIPWLSPSPSQQSIPLPSQNTVADANSSTSLLPQTITTPASQHTTNSYSPLHNPIPFIQQVSSSPTPLQQTATSNMHFSPTPSPNHFHLEAAIPSSAPPSSPGEPSFLPLPQFKPSSPQLPVIGPLFPRKSGMAAQVLPTFFNETSSSIAAAVQGGVRREDFDQLMRQKVKLEGQLEILGQEAQATLQERAELQAQLASLQLKLKSTQKTTEDAEKASLRAELERLRSTRMEHEREATEVQRMLEEKMEELKAVTEDLYQSQDTVDKLQVRMKELRDDLQAKEITVQALKSKIAELYVEVQTTLQSKMDADSEARTAQNDLVTLVKAKEWYQEQLSVAHEVRAKLQHQLTMLQAQTVSQGSIVERLKMESARLRQQLSESQQRALREKEQLACHLEAIQNDMMEREAAFQEIQRERYMIEDTFNTQFSSVEEEKSRIDSLLHLSSDLESQLEKAHANSKKKQEQIFALENEQMDLMKKLTLAQEVLVDKEQCLEEVNQKLIEVESQLDAFMKTVTTKDAELLQLREDKAATEIALKAALQEKASVDKSLETIKDDMGKVEKSFKQMRQELGVRQVELQTAQSEQKKTRDELDRVAHELDIKTRSVETLIHSHEEQVAHIQELHHQKMLLESELRDLKTTLKQAEIHGIDSQNQEALKTELQQTKAQLEELKIHLQTATNQLQKSTFTSSQQLEISASSQQTDLKSDSKLRETLAENDVLKKQVGDLMQAKDAAEFQHKQAEKSLTSHIDSLKSKITEEKSEFEKNIHSYVEKLRQVTDEKRKLETELEMMHRKWELNSVQQQGEIKAEMQNMIQELEAVQLQKQELESRLLELQQQKSAEVKALQDHLAERTLTIQRLYQDQEHQQTTEQLNLQLALELEKERGRIAGLQQSNLTLKEHMKQLEEALAGRESSLVELNSFLQKSSQEHIHEQQESLRRIQELELVLQKEKNSGRDLRKQIGSKITENKRLLNQQEVSKKELVELQEHLQQKEVDSSRLLADLDSTRHTVRNYQAELQSLQGEKHVLESELEKVKRALADNTDRNPVLLEQIQNLEWQLTQRNQEVKAIKEQLVLAEQRQMTEMEGLRQALQGKQEELANLQHELAAVRQERTDQKSRVAELRSALKASVQHHKLTGKLNKKKETGAEGGNGNVGYVIPPLPFDMEVVEKLLQDTAVKPLDSKPLDNLSNCLSSLRAEISGLQKQMEVHTTHIHSSSESWKNVETEVKELQEVVRSIANTIMDTSHASALITTTAADTEQLIDSDVHII